MKKFYSAPVVEIEKFDVADIITASQFLGSDEIKANAAATDNIYTQAVGVEW